MKTDEFRGTGGSFIKKDGKRVRVAEPTRPSETGGARDDKGAPLPGTDAATELSRAAAEAETKARATKKPTIGSDA